MRCARRLAEEELDLKEFMDPLLRELARLPGSLGFPAPTAAIAPDGLCVEKILLAV